MASCDLAHYFHQRATAGTVFLERWDAIIPAVPEARPGIVGTFALLSQSLTLSAKRQPGSLPWSAHRAGLVILLCFLHEPNDGDPRIRAAHRALGGLCPWLPVITSPGRRLTWLHMAARCLQQPVAIVVDGYRRSRTADIPGPITAGASA